jgi:hypothetical protein
VARLVILWTRPYHLSAEEADGWTRREAARLLALEGVERAELTRLDSAPSRHVLEWDWMLDLHLRDGIDARRCVEEQACEDWLLDLRLLGMRPAVVVVEESTTLTPEAR